jgi:rubrerythrin
MERYDDFSRERFDAVWQRVMRGRAENGPAPTLKTPYAEPGDADGLRRVMDDETGDAQFYSALACKCSGPAREPRRRIASAERCHLKILRARYFILTGKTYAPPDSCPLIYSPADALRRKYAGEKEGAEKYGRAAEQASDPDLRDTYLTLSREEARHAKTVCGIIENLF